MTAIKQLQLEHSLVEMTGNVAKYLNQVSGSFSVAPCCPSDYAESTDGLIKKGYINRLYYNIILNIKLNAEYLEQGKDTTKGVLLKIQYVTTKKRYLIPALFYGLSGRKPAEPGTVSPALVALLTNVTAFVKFLQLKSSVTINKWEDFPKSLFEPDGKDIICQLFNGDKALQAAKNLINSKDPANEINPQTPVDMVLTDPPVSASVLENGKGQFILENKNGKKGFSVYVQTIDGKWFFVTGTGWQNNLIVAQPGNCGIRLPENTANIYIMYNQSKLPKLDTGCIWGRFYLYEEE